MPTTLKAKQLITTALETGSITTPSHVAWGIDNTAFDETDNVLGSELVRNGITTTNKSSTSIEWTATLGTAQGNGSDIEEVGLFNASSGGDMFIRNVIYPVGKTSSFEYDIVALMRIK